MCRPCVGHEVANGRKVSKVAQGHDRFQSSGGPEVVGSVGTMDIGKERRSCKFRRFRRYRKWRYLRKC